MYSDIISTIYDMTTRYQISSYQCCGDTVLPALHRAFLTASTIAIAVHSVSCSSAKKVVTILFKD